MTYQDILNKRNEVKLAYQKEEDAITKLEKKIEWHKKRKSKINTGYIATILIPLATEICKRKGFKHFDIYGPFGITCKTSIYFSNTAHTETDEMKTSIDICNVDTYGITLTPTDNCESKYQYWTGEETNEFAKDTIGYLNGMNNVYKPLPADIDEVIKLLRFSKGKSSES